jgi:hypothetical protein
MGAAFEIAEHVFAAIGVLWVAGSLAVAGIIAAARRRRESGFDDQVNEALAIPNEERSAG